MNRCKCGAFVPSTQCPDCGAATPQVRPRRRFKNAALGAISAITLAACYGAAYPEPQMTDEPVCEDSSLDQDGDGWCGEYDTDESNPDVH